MGNSLSSGTIEINNFEELLEFAEAGVKPGQKQLKLSPELGVLVIHAEGEGYGNFIPGEQLRSLWQIQEDFFRLAAYALHRAPPGSQGPAGTMHGMRPFFSGLGGCYLPYGLGHLSKRIASLNKHLIQESLLYVFKHFQLSLMEGKN